MFFFAMRFAGRNFGSLGMAITLADPGGPIEAAKETMAAFKGATNPPSREQLLAEVALEIQAMTQQSATR